MDLVGPYPKKKGPPVLVHGGTQKKAAAYSPTWFSSTNGADGLNFPVRNGKGWAPSPWPPKIVGRDIYVPGNAYLYIVDIIMGQGVPKGNYRIYKKKDLPCAPSGAHRLRKPTGH